MFNRILEIVEDSKKTGGFKWESVTSEFMEDAKISAAYCVFSEAMADSTIPRREQRKFIEEIKLSNSIPQSAFCQSSDRWLTKSDIQNACEVVNAFATKGE